MKQTNICRLRGDITRMVQLPATAAIEFAACWVSGAGGVGLSGGAFVWGHFWPGAAFVRGVFCPGGLLSGAHYIFYPSTIWFRPLSTELGPKKSQKNRFCHEANEYMSP